VGVAQVGLILVLTVVGLPCAFFTLLALLDRFERSLSPNRGLEHAVATAVSAVTAIAPASAEPALVEPTAAVVSLPIHIEHPAAKRATNESSAAAV
jgi:hypothetical protein